MLGSLFPGERVRVFKYINIYSHPNGCAPLASLFRWERAIILRFLSDISSGDDRSFNSGSFG
jgi:hypothetical protein